ncbi:hypothetical protein EMA8858_01250 [Emticicia aquatica]|jgi:multidrug transporter EmrE-like cation transporter|uniref:Uncharacterized protein n=1 Tax=Emticicia aquatica TaxID=1681835 RepID=A0ABM9ANS5_9BACT|nr:hypothetical protein [Emticicia aquatica]CAH0995130.1 hypothetical protein EMA8858_01250 [Emticicia aquatica]
MDKNKLSFYSSYVAIACGILLLVMKLFSQGVSTVNTVMGLLFIVIGIVGLKRFKNS